MVDWKEFDVNEKLSLTGDFLIWTKGKGASIVNVYNPDGGFIFSDSFTGHLTEGSEVTHYATIDPPESELIGFNSEYGVYE